jgi:hypothetical protein
MELSWKAHTSSFEYPFHESQKHQLGGVQAGVSSTISGTLTLGVGKDSVLLAAIEYWSIQLRAGG